MALLGGAVLVSDGRLLGLMFADLPVDKVLEPAHRMFVLALIVIVLTGVFMACSVSIKIYYLPVFWFKMLALSAGVLFVFFVRRPLLCHEIEDINPWVVRMVAVASTTVWVTVAACGRWIGFSG